MVKVTGVSIDYGFLRGDHRYSATDNEKFVIGWKAVSDNKNDCQEAYRVVVSTENETLWDTGKVIAKGQSVRYGGKTLPVGRAVFVSVKIWSERGEESKFYTDYFYFASVDWRAPWIAVPEKESVSRRPARFRKKFNVDGDLKNAYLVCCGIGYQSVYINGERISEAKLDPAHSDYTKTCYYTFEGELGDFLQQGENEIEVVVADGWRNFDSEFWLEVIDHPGFHGRPQVSLMFNMEYEDGSCREIFTDDSWEWSHFGIVEASLYDGEIYDAREDVENWREVCIAKAPGGKMELMKIPPIMSQEEYYPVDVFRLEKDKYILDFGQNLAGVLRVTLPEKMREGQEITLAHAEILTEEGDLYTEPLRKAKCTDRYVAAGDERDLGEWEPEFTYRGFRYVRVTGYGEIPEPEKFVAVALRTDIEETGEFVCGSALLTKIHENVVMTEKANIHSILTDCPQRDERFGWMNDATVRFEAIPYNFDMGQMFVKVIQDLIDVQGEDGSICCTAPFVAGKRPADPVCSSYLVAGMQSLLHCGNFDIIGKAYRGFKAWEEYLLTRSQDYIVDYTYYGDWASPDYVCEGEEGMGVCSNVTPGVLMSTGYSYYNCVLLTEFARLLGKAADAEKYDDLAKKIQKAFLDKWFDRETCVVATGSQACQAFALWLKILPEECCRKAAAIMRENLVNNNYMITTGNLCTKYLLDMLTEYGYVEDAYKIMAREEYPSFGYMIQNEATTIWERFELKKNPEMNSHSHPMYGSVDYWFFAYVLGAKPMEYGWKKAVIRPYYPEKLLSARGSVETPYGTLSIKWTKKYGTTQLYVTVPFGMRAEITHGDITEEVGSGSYAFVF